MTSSKFFSERVSFLRRRIIPAVNNTIDDIPMPTTATNGKKATAKARDATTAAMAMAAATAPSPKSILLTPFLVLRLFVGISLGIFTGGTLLLLLYCLFDYFHKLRYVSCLYYFVDYFPECWNCS